jgi:AraC-like DNA-binding protein
LRTFQHVVGLTPHQYVMRMRLQRAAVRLVEEAASVLEIAFDSGFGDVSNFNRSFRVEFGMSPRTFRRGAGARQTEKADSKGAATCPPADRRVP